MDEKFSTKLPPCSEWGLWLGEEIEGHTERGVTTLFVRQLPEGFPLSYFEDSADLGITRIWFCQEFNDWEMLEAIAPLFKTRCLESTPELLVHLRPAIRELVTVYLKIPVVLRPGDHVCVGPAFADESFEIGTGRRVTPSEYEKDKLIL